MKDFHVIPNPKYPKNPDPFCVVAGNIRVADVADYLGKAEQTAELFARAPKDASLH